VPDMHAYDYAILRVVPSVEREEFVNAGVILHCPELAFLDCRIEFDEVRLRGLCPDLDIAVVRSHLQAFSRICTSDPEGGPIARLSRSERFAWQVAPRSTIIQVSPVHSGMCESPGTTLDEIFRRLVRK